jgi:citrate synthase
LDLLPIILTGILRYRGYPIEELAEQSSFLEVSYLLYYGELPTKGQLTAFATRTMHEQEALASDIVRLINGFRCVVVHL